MVKRKRVGASAAAMRAFKRPRTLAKRVRKLERGIEKKHYDYALKATAATGGYTHTGSAIRINLIPKGDDESSRTGREVWLESVLLRLHAQAVEANGLVGLRTIILYDKADDGGSINGSNYLDFSAVINGEEYLAPLRKDRTADLTVLYDDTMGLNKDSLMQVNGDAAGNTVFTIVSNAWRKINKRTQFSSTTGIASTGSLILLLVGNQWASATADPDHKVALTTRVTYTDS